MEPVQSVRGRSVRGLAHLERRVRLRSSRNRHLRPAGSTAREKRSASCHWASRFSGPLRVSTQHLPEAAGCSTPGPAGDPARRLARWPCPLSRPGWPWALATDSALGPQRSRTELGAPNRGQAGVGRRPLKLTTGGRGRHPACESTRSRTGTLCLPGRAQRIQAGGLAPARRLVAFPAAEHTVPVW